VSFLSENSTQRQFTADFKVEGIVVQWTEGTETQGNENSIEAFMRRPDGKHATQIVSLGTGLRRGRALNRLREAGSRLSFGRRP